MRVKNKLDRILPLGLVATRGYMLAQGMDRHGFDNAVKSGKLKAICRGVYVRDGLSLSWQGVMSSLNLLYESQSVYLGGLSALEQSGFNHYLKRNPTIHVYAAINKPKWLDYLELNVDFVWHSTTRLWNEISTNDFIQIKWREDVPVYMQASVEHACLELLADVPNDLSFEHADSLFQGLSTLSPRKLKIVLNQCKSVKAKRLFFWFAKRHGFAWNRHLNVTDYDLGKGKRMIDKNGVLDKGLLITVPNDL
ncbi:MAG: type IV toxin-antitoxin system AbiEi family antitoxin domain-containing protein [Marinicellaceae bacterium]